MPLVCCGYQAQPLFRALWHGSTGEHLLKYSTHIVSLDTWCPDPAAGLYDTRYTHETENSTSGPIVV